jgi:hypothetical protein
MKLLTVDVFRILSRGTVTSFPRAKPEDFPHKFTFKPARLH